LTPHLLKGIGHRTGGMDKEPTTLHNPGNDPMHIEALYEGMQDAVERGTVNTYRGVIPDIAVCGKTGTSQNKKGKDHSIFIAFAPRENPKIAIAVVVENGGFGGSAAAPIASLMIEQYIKGKIERRAVAEQVKALNFSTTASQKAAKPILQ
ncbi:MAG: penicillin-binding transpeptidase domain-containing protein, partial [Spirosomaceae bacterium]|nr:penicillin-binding transpeptidase domain-containing protein [Spirosomataceae bacterium]